MILKAVSLFSCGGIGDLALKGAGIEVILANELDPARAEVFCHNFPDVEMVIGDIWEKKDFIVSEANKLLSHDKVDIVFATPPCQGMSKNGRGKLLNLIRKGERPKLDPRNQLVIPAIDIFIELGAETLVMENVPEMANTLISSSKSTGNLVSIPEYIMEKLGDEFSSSIKVVEFADYGVPQKRQRLISVFSKNANIKEFIAQHGTIFPPKTHSKTPSGSTQRWVTVRDVISSFPKLDAGSKEGSVNKDIPHHRVPLLDKDKYLWVSNTPAGKSAFDNQCINPACGYTKNTTHGSKHDKEGINKSNTTTPINCQKCGKLLPRPWVREGDGFRLMKGYVSAYKRMSYDSPSSALTRNFSYACSDNKLHPEQNRVLSIHEACVLHTLSHYNYSWKRQDGKKVSDKLIRELIGESIPPYGLQHLFEFFVGVKKGLVTSYIDEQNQISLI
jgi:DNA (cytosine-5)-methyltransferase 1